VAGPDAAATPACIQIATVVVRGAACLLSPHRVWVGEEIVLLLSTGTNNARVKHVRAAVAVGYLTEYSAAADTGTQGKTANVRRFKKEGLCVF